jgi:hypothetical protein
MHRSRRLVLALLAAGAGAAPAAAFGMPAQLPTGPAPVNTIAPGVSGTARQGQTLSASTGTWTPLGASYTYQWQHNMGSGFIDITAATGATFLLQGADINSNLRVVVTATNGNGQASATSSAVGPVLPGAPVDATAPSVSGALLRGSALAVNAGVWSPMANRFGLQWERNSGGGFQNIAGASGSSYVLTKADEGASIRAMVTAVNDYGLVTLLTAAIGPVQAAPPVDSAPPTVVGAAQRGTKLVATTGSWTGSGNAYVIQWQRDSGSGFQAISGATSPSYTLTAADEGATLRVLVTVTNVDATASQASQATQAVAPAPAVNTGAPTVIGVAQRAQTLTATTGSWTGAGNTYAYQWQLNAGSGFQNIVGATTAAYTLSAGDELATVRVVVTAANADDVVSQASQATQPVAQALPLNTAPPAISGFPRLNATLTVYPGVWTPAGSTLTYDWQRGDATNGYQDIIGATGPTYTLQAADLGKAVRAIVTAANVDGTQRATAPPTPLIAQPPQSITLPSAPAGTLMDSYALTAASGTWDTPSAQFAYAWMRCAAGATAISSACAEAGTGPTHAVAAVDVGHTLGVLVTATSAGGSSTVSSALTAPIAGRPLVNLTPPPVIGTPQIPLGLSAGEGTWSVPLTGVAYTWFRCDSDGVSNCSQVTSSDRYQLGVADRGHTVVLVATATSPGRTATASSQAVTVLDQPLPRAVAVPTVSGTASRTSLLRAITGSWTNSPTLSLQWLRCAPDGSACQPIAGAIGIAYSLTLADEGHAITIQVTATDTTGSVIATAAPTVPIASAPPVNTHVPTIKGTAQQGMLVGATGTTWSATPDTTFSYSWQRCAADGTNCHTVNRATSGVLVLTAADVGDTLVALVTATNADGSRTVVSAPSAVVLPLAPRWLTVPAVSADRGRVGDVLGLTRATWGPPALTGDTTQWMRCTNTCTAIGAPNATSYTIASTDLGVIIRVKETASNAVGSTTVWSTNYVGPVTSAASASAVLGSGSRVFLRSARGAVLAVAQLTALAAAADSGQRSPAAVVELRRARGVHGTLQAWACPLAGKRGGPPPACSARAALRSRATIRVPDGATGRVRVVVVHKR